MNAMKESHQHRKDKIKALSYPLLSIMRYMYSPAVNHTNNNERDNPPFPSLGNTLSNRPYGGNTYNYKNDIMRSDGLFYILVQNIILLGILKPKKGYKKWMWQEKPHPYYTII